MKTSLDRRSVVAAIGVGALSALSPASTARSAKGKPVIGLTAGMLGGELATDPIRGLAIAKALGVTEIELRGTLGKSPRDFRAIMRRFGVGRHAYSVNSQRYRAGLTDPTFDEDPAALIGQAQDDGVKHLIAGQPFFPERILEKLRASTNIPETLQNVVLKEMTADDWRHHTDMLARCGEKCKAAGIRLSYHNHNVEFGDFNGLVPIEDLFARTDPSVLGVQLDVGWVKAAGPISSGCWRQTNARGGASG